MANGRDDREENKKPESTAAKIVKASFFALLMVGLVWSFKQGQKYDCPPACPDAGAVRDGGHG